MGKYKSYIFLGITLFILMIVGYCVAKNSKKKKDEKEEVKTEQTIEKSNLPISPEQNETQEGSQIQKDTHKPVNNVEQPIQSTQVTQKTTNIPKKEIEDIPSLKVGLKVGENNFISWNSILKNSSKYKLQLVIYRKGQIYSEEDVTGKSSIIYDPSDYHENGKENLQGLNVRIELKIIGNVNLLDKNSIESDDILCSPKK